ncbi:MAG: diguanylate cyclase [Alphaproteobacteria bacterium]|nr:diguanylate cyclase [Alphaproteobacteria bacterium]MBF0249584.1 diguanylate cyclase [Alphaproteobacteria bacterium]
MKLNTKVTTSFALISTGLIIMLVAINLYAFRTFSIASSTDHIRTAAEIVRVGLTESMINGVIDQREGFLKRLVEVQGLSGARVVRSHHVVGQFGEGTATEMTTDEIEKQVLTDGQARYEVVEKAGDTFFRGTIPFTATAHGSPNCLECHEVKEGDVLGAVTISMSIGNLKDKAILTVSGIIGTVALFTLAALLLVSRLIRPLSLTADNVKKAVHKALDGDFTTKVKKITDDEMGQIAQDMNRLLAFLDEGLNAIGANVARLTNRAPQPGENLLDATTDMVDGLTRASIFKQAIEEDESKEEILQRLARVIATDYGVTEYSIYEIDPQKKNQMVPTIVDGELGGGCKWCDPQILVRGDGCRARRTGHVIDGISDPDICYSFRPPEGCDSYRYVCIPVIQAGSVGNVVQLIAKPGCGIDTLAQVPFIKVYLREAAPVLETKRLMATLKESSLRDPMTGLNNRRFLEEYIDTLVANADRRQIGLTIMMLDLDHFKMVNDTYGHDAGDDVIKALAKVLRQTVRASDMVIRFGGEEFLVVLVDTVGTPAQEVAEKIRSTIESMEIITAGTKLKKTISIGSAEYPKDADTFWQALKFADVALYEAKEQGRNRVIHFAPEMWTDDQSY